MALWLIRAGKFGEYENKFLNDNRVYITWDKLKVDLAALPDKIALYGKLQEIYAGEKPAAIRNYTGQLWPFGKDIQKGDWVVLPSKFKSAIHIGEITGEYEFHPTAENPYYHSRKVKWFALDIPRSNFEQDLLYSFGAFMSVCRISRNDAEARIKAMAKNNWQPASVNENKPVTRNEEIQTPEAGSELVINDLGSTANDQIAQFIIRKFKGHGMAQIVNAILKAKGYTTHLSPEGPDKGVDILAAPEPLGFGKPRLCVQVKTSDKPIERQVLDQLIGTMTNFQAEQGLLVSWSGFNRAVEKETANQFFRVRLWGQKEIIQELLANYDHLDDEMRAEIPLKRIWTLALGEGD